jgi:undecaprenyl-diphosphatase
MPFISERERTFVPQQPVHKQLEENVQHLTEEAQQEVARSREPWYWTLRRGQILSVIYIIAFILFTLLAWFVHIHPILAIDVAISQEFQENSAPWLRFTMIAVSYPGYHLVLFSGLIVLTALIFWLLQLRLEALLILAESAVSSLLNVPIKLIVARPRPAEPMVDIIQAAHGPSFPSGHVMSYVAFWGLLFSLTLMLFKKDRWWYYTLLIISGLFVVLVGPSRIYLGDHWASDVIGGYLFGGLLLAIGLRIYLALKARGVLQKSHEDNHTLS